jgi:signal peptidase II
MKKSVLSHILFAVAAALTLVLDQVTKRMIVSSLDLYQSVQVLGDWFRLTRVHNFGMSFGIFNNGGQPGPMKWVLLAFSLFALGFLVWMYVKNSTRVVERMAIGFIMGGAAGNFIDRFHPGYVVDFLDFGIGNLRFFTFNVSDCGITFGLALLLIVMMIDEQKKKKEALVKGPDNAA